MANGFGTAAPPGQPPSGVKVARSKSETSIGAGLATCPF